VTEKEEQIGSSGGGERGQRVQWRVYVLPKVKGAPQQFQASGVYKPTVRAVYYKLFCVDANPREQPKDVQRFGENVDRCED
jgi:hypothetical protein